MSTDWIEVVRQEIVAEKCRRLEKLERLLKAFEDHPELMEFADLFVDVHGAPRDWEATPSIKSRLDKQ